MNWFRKVGSTLRIAKMCKIDLFASYFIQFEAVALYCQLRRIQAYAGRDWTLGWYILFYFILFVACVKAFCVCLCVCFSGWGGHTECVISAELDQPQTAAASHQIQPQTRGNKSTFNSQIKSTLRLEQPCFFSFLHTITLFLM